MNAGCEEFVTFLILRSASNRLSNFSEGERWTTAPASFSLTLCHCVVFQFALPHASADKVSRLISDPQGNLQMEILQAPIIFSSPFTIVKSIRTKE